MMLAFCLFYLNLHLFTDAATYIGVAKVYKNLDPTVVLGTITFTQTDETSISITGTLSGLSNVNAVHGFHVHDLGNLGSNNNCTSAGAHYNPLKVDHAGPDNDTRHIGDIGNVNVDGRGTATVNINLPASKIPLVGVHSVVGRAIVIHSDPDDLGLGNQADSKTTGHAGSRLGCGIIGVANGFSPAGTSSGSNAATPRTVVANIMDPTGKMQYGVIQVQQATADSQVRVTGQLSNIDKKLNSKHGFHVHQFGNITDCASAGAHWNPSNNDHAGPVDSTRHIGDLGNIDVTNTGTARIDISLPADKFPLVGPNSIVGRVIVLHEDEDDLGRGGQTDSKTTGHAGARLGCGVLGVASDFSPAGSGSSVVALWYIMLIPLVGSFVTLAHM